MHLIWSSALYENIKKSGVTSEGYLVVVWEDVSDDVSSGLVDLFVFFDVSALKELKQGNLSLTIIQRQIVI